MVVFRVERGGVIKQCVVSEDTMCTFFLSFEHSFTSNRQICFLAKTGMIGALLVLVPGWGGGRVSKQCDIRRGSAVHASFISINQM